MNKSSRDADLTPSVWALDGDPGGCEVSPPAIRPAMVRIRLSPARERTVREGHPWLFSDSVDGRIRGEGVSGSLAALYGARNRMVGIGLYDPDSPIRVRVLQRGAGARLDLSWFGAALDRALARREGLATATTNAYRVIHGENDGVPGVVVDRYDQVLVVKLDTLAWRPWLSPLLGALRTRLDPRTIVLRCSDRLSAPPGLFPSLLGSGIEEPVHFLENGVRFEADLVRGQKTGFFLEQRDNRQFIRERSDGQRVLNVFAFSGGFSVYAALGGAQSVASLDQSPHALEAADRNWRLNADFHQAAHEILQGDAFELLEQLGEKGRKFDLVILDPPSFARRARDRDGALGAYRRLNVLGARLVAPAGFLFSCSCSAHIDEESFENTVTKALSPGDFRLIDKRGHAQDHPVGFPEGRYLKALYYRRFS